jgi:hypothetical protein
MCRKYLRVSEMLVLDSMVHLKSEIPIESRAPVARSQLLNRQSVSGELQEPFQSTVIPTHDMRESSTYVVRGRSTFHQTQGATLSPHDTRIPLIEELPPNPQHVSTQYPVLQKTPQQCSQQHVSQHHPAPPPPRKTSYYGYNPATPENLTPLSSLPSKTPGDTIGTSLSLSH